MVRVLIFCPSKLADFPLAIKHRKGPEESNVMRNICLVPSGFDIESELIDLHVCAWRHKPASLEGDIENGNLEISHIVALELVTLYGSCGQGAYQTSLVLVPVVSDHLYSCGGGDEKRC